MALATDPTQTGRTGTNFGAGFVYYAEHHPRLIPGSGYLQIGAEGHYSLCIRRAGGIELEVPLDYLMGPPTIPGYEGELVLSDVGIAEFLVFVVWLLRGLTLLQEPPGDQVVGQLALFELKGARLRPGSVSPFALLRSPGREALLQPYPKKAFTLDRVWLLGREQILENPDLIAFRILRELFEAFGYPESFMPPEFDRKTGRLILTE